MKTLIFVLVFFLSCNAYCQIDDWKFYKLQDLKIPSYSRIDIETEYGSFVGKVAEGDMFKMPHEDTVFEGISTMPANGTVVYKNQSATVKKGDYIYIIDDKLVIITPEK